MKWSDLKGAFGKAAGGAAKPAAANAGGAAALDSLREQLRSPDENARVRAVEALAGMGGESSEQQRIVLDLLVGFVRDRCPYLGGDEPDAPPRDIQAVIRVVGQPRADEGDRLVLGLFQVDLRKADFSEAYLVRADFSRSHLESADFTGSRLEAANFQEAFLNDAHFMGAAMRGANLLAADLDRANFTGAELAGAHLQEASLKDTVLVGVRFDGTVLNRADLTGARLEGANLAGAVGVTREQLAGAHVDARTVLPNLD